MGERKITRIGSGIEGIGPWRNDLLHRSDWPVCHESTSGPTRGRAGIVLPLPGLRPSVILRCSTTRVQPRWANMAAGPCGAASRCGAATRHLPFQSPISDRAFTEPPIAPSPSNSRTERRKQSLIMASLPTPSPLRLFTSGTGAVRSQTIAASKPYGSDKSGGVPG